MTPIHGNFAIQTARPVLSALIDYRTRATLPLDLPSELPLLIFHISCSSVTSRVLLTSTNISVRLNMTRRVPVTESPAVVPMASSTTEAPTQPKVVKPAEKRHTVTAGHGFAFNVKAGTHFRVVDLHGEQVVDMVAWVEPYPKSSIRASGPASTMSSTTSITMPVEYLSMSNSRYHLSGVHPALSEHLYTNASRPIFTLVADTCKSHDMTFMCCHPEFYDEMDLHGHRACASNISEAVSALKGKHMSHLQVTDPFNTFQNTPNYTLKPLGNSKKGDYVEWKVVRDALVAVSSCPFDQGGFNGGKITDVEVVWDIVP